MCYNELYAGRIEIRVFKTVSNVVVSVTILPTTEIATLLKVYIVRGGME